ncbi:hypothetical protein GQ44DRAFT_696217 [Phaeosphaeriaceae sp. PMI808]|nr:hypothetical protein GQ44DRAFT_696217 [Phaeosphaeriaceae sp. PMI808]
MSCIEDLSDDVLYLITSYFRSDRLSTLCCLRLVSKRLSAFADSLLCRTITFGDDNLFQEQATYHYIERLLDPTDASRQLVRFLHVQSFRGDKESYCMNTELLLACVRSIRKLDSFSWDSKSPLPEIILDALHLCHPGAQLCISADRLNQAATSSPQLHRLSCSIPCSSISNPDSMAPLEDLKRILIQSRNLRALSVDVHQDPNPRHAVEKKAKELRMLAQPSYLSSMQHKASHSQFLGYQTAGNNTNLLETTYPVQIPLVSTDRLPPLEELAFKAIRYKLNDERHCHILSQCMDWNKLKRLSLGPLNPEIFFHFFTNRIPILEHLEFSHRSRSHKRITFRRQDLLRTCSKFISSLNQLKTLIIHCDVIDFSHHFWLNLGTTHGGCLEALSLLACYDGLEPPTCCVSQLDFLTCFTALKTLDLATETFFAPHACTNCEEATHNLSTEYIKNIPFLTSLQTINVSVRVYTSGKTSLHSYIANHAHCAIRGLWARYCNQSSDHDLESFKLHFWRWETPSPHPDEDGIIHHVRIHRIAFEGRKRGAQLFIKEHDDGNIISTWYDEVWRSSGGNELKATYVPRLRKESHHALILGD